MSIESLLLSAWEEGGFVGKTRVPLDRSDVDVLAIHPGQGKVRIGECKVQQGSQAVFLVDESSLAWMETQPYQDFTAWMGDDWSGWLENLPGLWDAEGRPAVPWLLHLSKVEMVEVVFCCNLHVLCEQSEVDNALRRAAERMLSQNPALAERLSSGLAVEAWVKPTVEVGTDLVRAVFGRIESGYGRRFGEPFKDILREIHRYLWPELDRLPYDRGGQQLGSRKAPFQEDIRKATALCLLGVLDIGEEELREWLADGGEGAGEVESA